MWGRIPAMNVIRLAPVLAVTILVSSGCQDLRTFTGTWSGEAEQSELIRRGFPLHTTLRMNIGYITDTELDATVSIDDGTPVPVILDRTWLNDVFSDMTYRGDPLLVHIGWISVGGKSYMTAIGYFKGPELEVRLMSEDMYGVFHMKKE